LFKFFRIPITHKKKKINNFLRLPINEILTKVVRRNPYTIFLLQFKLLALFSPIIVGDFCLSTYFLSDYSKIEQ